MGEFAVELEAYALDAPPSLHTARLEFGIFSTNHRFCAFSQMQLGGNWLEACLWSG